MRKFIGVDIGGTNIRAAIVSEDGTILNMKKSESHPERGAEAVMETMTSLIESLEGYEECEGIGMGIPGPIDTVNGKIIAQKFPHLPGVELHSARVPGDDRQPFIHISTSFSPISPVSLWHGAALPVKKTRFGGWHGTCLFLYWKNVHHPLKG